MSNLNKHVVHLTTEELKDIIDERLSSFQNNKNLKESNSKVDIVPELLTRQEVADKFRVSFVTLHNWVKHGVLPKPIKKGKMVYFLRKEIVESLESRKSIDE
jgi:predicted DNA-binding transcriptional regulator AlpA